MKRLFGIFALTPGEQRLVLFVMLLLVAFAWFKHRRDLSHEAVPSATSTTSPAPDAP